MRILLPVDGSEHSRHAIRFIAERVDRGTVELLNVQHIVPEALIELLGLESVRNAYQDEGHKIFESLKDVTEPLNAKEVTLGGDLGSTIAREADRMDADLIVMGSRGRSAVGGLFLGSVSAQVLSRTERPLLLIRDKVPTGPLRVGLCVDKSDYARAAAELVVNNKEFFGEGTTFEVINVAKTEQDWHEAAEPILTLFAEAGIPCGETHLKGHVGDAICEYAQTHLDLIVMGSHGYGNFRAAFLGSTAMRIAAGSEVPLLISKAH